MGTHERMVVAVGLVEFIVKLDGFSEHDEIPDGGMVDTTTVPVKRLIEVRVIVEVTVCPEIPAREVAVMLKSVPIVNTAIVVWKRPPMVAFMVTM